MKRFFIAVLTIIAMASNAGAQVTMRVELENGELHDFPVENVKRVTWVTTSSEAPKDLEAIDMGLPSGMKWANMNIGATTPEGYGYYFAWGETAPKKKYNGDTYKWPEITKYVTDPASANRDDKTTLEYEDDAARAIWGGSWRMPTISEYSELYGYCTITWTTQDGVNGYKFTSMVNGNSIFFPAAGAILNVGGENWDSKVSYANECSFYWSSTLYNYNYEDGRAYTLDFSESRYWSATIRCYGLSVRAVCP